MAGAKNVVTIKVDGEEKTLDEVRKILGIPEIECVGCWLGDAGPETHDYSYGCEIGPYGGDL